MAARRVAVWLAAVVASSGVGAQTTGGLAPVVGFPAGPWIIAPSLVVGYGYDSNVLLQPAANSPIGDNVTTLQPTLQVALPFSHSLFRVADTLRWQDYKKTSQTAGKTSNDANGELALRFSTLDELHLAARSVNGIAETVVFDPSGEAQGFKGNPYLFHTESVSVTRDLPGVRGYRFTLTRNALAFDRPVTFEFLEYRGFDGEAAYVEPLSPNTRLSFGYLGTRYDLYLLAPESDPTQVFRRENGNTLYGQVEGRLGPRLPYVFRIGWERLAFDLDAGLADYSGPIWNGSLGAIVGGGTTFSVTLQRQPYRSTTADNNYYLTDQVGARVVRSFVGGSSVGGSATFSRYTYGQPIEGVYRTDRAYSLEVYGSLTIRNRVNFRIAVVNNRRGSQFANGDYDSVAVTGGFILGWI